MCWARRRHFVAITSSTGVTLKDVGLRGAASLEIARGVERLAGAVVSVSQLLDLAPVLAVRLGIRVEG